ncbi:MAG TPA: hypothetical protein DCY89_03475 [Gammaproteobacteria bacterium]|nr:hypothetical protein [Gammaproteobacteria bacterium]
MSAPRLPEGLRGQFWDTDFDRLDPALHARFVTERLMAMTTPEALRWLIANYTAAELLVICDTSRRLTSRDRNFWRLYLHAS